MIESSIDRRQGHQRVTFEEPVQVHPSGSGQQLWARAADLSESGIFVSSQRLFGVGTEIGLRLPIAAGRGLVVRGRVVRVTGEPSPGMGIAFEALNEAERAALRRAVMEGRSLGWTREARVWFAGTAQPTRVQARVGPEGLRLFCDLGFMRLGSPVVLYFDQEEQSYSGVLEAARLCTDQGGTVPRLELAMSLEGELPAATQTWTAWPPPPLGDDEDGLEAAEAGELTEDDLIIEAAPPDDGEEIYPLRRPDTALQDTAAGAIWARSLSSPELPQEPSVQVPVILETPPSVEPPLQELPTVENNAWDLASLPAAEQSSWTLRSEGLALPRPRRRRRRPRVWMWLLAGLMTSLAVASMTYTRFWERASDKLLSWGAVDGLRTGALLQEAAPVPLLPAEPVVEEDSPASPNPAAPPSAVENGRPVSGTSGAPAAPGSSVPGSLLPQGSTLLVPIEGSLAGAHHYLLATPDGVAINLPQARARVRLGDYRIGKDGFRTLWVRKRPQGGLHIRLLHEPGKLAEVQLSRAQVQITLKPGPPPTEEPAPIRPPLPAAPQPPTSPEEAPAEEPAP